MIISHLLLVHFIDTVFNQSAPFSNVNGRATSDQIDVLEDLSATFSNVNGRATSDQIDVLEDLVETLLSNMTSFETVIGK